jgi:hypothetical protein
MESRHTVKGYLAVERNDVLEDITALVSVRTIGNDLRIWWDPLLPRPQAETLGTTIPDFGGEVFIDGDWPD